jgi:hypothetical protein
METRLTLRPGQPGTRKLVDKCGERLVRVRYVYDPAGGRRLKTVELVVESVPWKARGRRPRRQDDDVVYVRIAYHETDLRERAKRLGRSGGSLRSCGRSLFEIARGWGSRIGSWQVKGGDLSTSRYMPAYGAIY